MKFCGDHLVFGKAVRQSLRHFEELVETIDRARLFGLGDLFASEFADTGTKAPIRHNVILEEKVAKRFQIRIYTGHLTLKKRLNAVKKRCKRMYFYTVTTSLHKLYNKSKQGRKEERSDANIFFQRKNSAILKRYDSQEDFPEDAHETTVANIVLSK